ncbi:MAG: CinA family protein [Christensenellales bacterium]
MNEFKFNVRAPEHTKDSERDRVAARVVAELIRRGWHITFAESCTGGLAAGRLVDVPDASTRT